MGIYRHREKPPARKDAEDPVKAGSRAVREHGKERRFMTRPGMKMNNTLAKELYAGRDLGRACASCRFYDEGLGLEFPICRRHKIRTNLAANCKEYDEKAQAKGA